jgi:diguanylate cyclase (GGDEF)-like protein
MISKAEDMAKQERQGQGGGAQGFDNHVTKQFPALSADYFVRFTSLFGVSLGTRNMAGTSSRLRFILLIALPITVAAIGMLIASSRMLDAVSTSVDQQEEIRTRQAVNSALGSLLERMEGLATDNARWDDAVDQVYGEPNLQWIYDTWGYSTADPNYDTSFVVEADGSPIAGHSMGEAFAADPRIHYHQALEQALRSTPQDLRTFDVITTFAQTPKGISAMAVAPILPTSEDMTVPGEKPRYLVLSVLLTPERLAKMSRDYIVDEMQLISLIGSVDSARGHPNVVNDAWNRPLAIASWKARHPGDAAKQSYLFTALSTVLALIGVMIPISVVHAQTMARLEANQEQARQAARHDSLSGLPNRLYFQEVLAEKMASTKPNELALAFIDLDGFKAVNDAYDHETGDKLIKSVAAGLSILVGDKGFVARLGGDEFAVLVTGPDAGIKAEAFASVMLSFVQEPFDLSGRIAHIGASIGIAESGSVQLEPAELMRRADIAMYGAKEAGRNRWRRFDDTLDAKRNLDKRIAEELRALIQKGRFDVAYQPIVDARSREIVCVEALARWPEGLPRKYDPDRFIAVAEEYGLIDHLCLLILKTAFREMRYRTDLRLAVNISPLQLNNPNLITDVKRIAEEQGFPLDRLEMEFTETVLIRNPKRAQAVIQDLRKAGVTVALDDFGIGYASVGYLRDYAFDKIKLDRSLTQGVLTNIEKLQVVQGTILIAKGLSAEIVAEGVETEQEAQLMQISGCHRLQGYLFGRPQPLNELFGRRKPALVVADRAIA